MKIESSLVQTIRILEVPKLDPITVSLDDENGKITIEVFGKSWSAYWYSAKTNGIISFFLTCENGYLINCLDRGLDATVTDFDGMPNFFKRLILKSRKQYDIDAKSAREMYDSLEYESFETMEQLWRFELKGIDGWFEDLPTRPNPDWVYLDRIVSAIKDSFVQLKQEPQS